MKINIKRMGINCSKWIVALVAAAPIILFIYCAPDISGGGSEAGNARISGMIIDTEGKPAANVRVLIVPAEYDPLKDLSPNDSFFDTTGSDGKYHFVIADSGRYSIQAAQEVSQTRALLSYIAGNEDDTVPLCKLQKPGTIRVMLPSGCDTVYGYIYIPGSTLFASLNHVNTYVFLDSVPAGTIPSVIYATVNSDVVSVIKSNIEVTSGDTASIIFPEWQFSRKIVLNTSSTGADVHDNVYNFPILVRLTAANFNFSQAKNEGDDVRFTTSYGKPLPYEIEKWNGTNCSAVIWVKIDTVFGNDSAQSITMYWGNPSADNSSEISKVFDTANGFQGVWHLSEETGNTFHDATQNSYFGISVDSTRPSIADGAVGRCCSFDGVNDFISMPNTAAGRLNFAQDGKFSVSAWVMADTLIDLQQTIISKDKYQYFLWIDSSTWQFWEFQDRTGWIASEHPAQSKQWVLLTGVCDGPTQQLYVNGEPTDIHSLKTDISARDTTGDLILGRAHEVSPNYGIAGMCYFKGQIDEVRITSTVQSAASVRLCYMNQRNDDRLVSFK